MCPKGRESSSLSGPTKHAMVAKLVNAMDLKSIARNGLEGSIPSHRTKQWRGKMIDCICEGNWRTIVTESEPLLDKIFECERTGKEYVFYGIVWGSDDFYYGMYSYSKGDSKLLSCVGSLEGHGFYLKE